MPYKYSKNSYRVVNIYTYIHTRMSVTEWMYLFLFFHKLKIPIMLVGWIDGRMDAGYFVDCGL